MDWPAMVIQAPMDGEAAGDPWPACVSASGRDPTHKLVQGVASAGLFCLQSGVPIGADRAPAE